jgi:hypothetical protein
MSAKALSADYRMLFPGCDQLMGVVNAYQCSNCDLHLAGNNLTKIVASFWSQARGPEAW